MPKKIYFVIEKIYFNPNLGGVFRLFRVRLMVGMGGVGGVKLPLLSKTCYDYVRNFKFGT